MSEFFVPPRLRRQYRSEIAEDPLENKLAFHVEESVRHYLDPDLLTAMAEDMGIVKRRLF